MAPPMIAYSLPAMQLVCNLVMPGPPGSNFTTATAGLTDQSPSKIGLRDLPDEYVMHHGIGSAYKFRNDSVTWITAKEQCILEGANLAVIDSWTKFDYVMNQTQIGGYLHVGIHSLYDDKVWVSATTGVTLTDLPWAQGEPNSGWDCVRTSSSPRGLRNFGCNTTFSGFICEIPIS